MGRRSRTVTIRAPPERVFALVDDSKRAPEWAEGIVAIREVDMKPGVVGSRFEVDIKEGGRVSTYEGLALAHEPPRLKRDRLSVRGSAMEMELAIEPASEGARLTQSVDFELQGGMRLMAPLVHWMLDRSLRKQTEKVKEIAEREAGR